MTLTLGVTIIFCYSTIGYYFLLDTFTIDDDELGAKYKIADNPALCDTNFLCFFQFINWGIRNGGGIADLIAPSRNLSEDKYTARWFYDLIFFFLIIVIMLNLVFGILINTFSGIRDKKYEDKQD
jgi:hypothetical protein